MTHEEYIQEVCNQALKLFKIPHLKFKPMKSHATTSRGFLNACTNLKTGVIIVDIYTPRLRRKKSISSILNTLCHEISHHQKPPIKRFEEGREVIIHHHPAFYFQMKKNINKLKKNTSFAKHFDYKNSTKKALTKIAKALSL